MKVREVNCSEADVLSARALFDAVGAIFDLREASVLDAFARNGQLTVSSYWNMLKEPRKQLECWELGSEHLPDLREYADNVTIGDSYETLESCKSTYDMIVIDTPQGLHRGKGGTWVEHFGFLPRCLKHVNPGGVVVLYVNKSPYNKDETGSHGYDEYVEYDFVEWMAGRRRFYGEELINEERAVRAYRKCLEGCGRTLGRFILIPCFSDVPGKEPYAFRLALEVL